MWTQVKRKHWHVEEKVQLRTVGGNGNGNVSDHKLHKRSEDPMAWAYIGN